MSWRNLVFTLALSSAVASVSLLAAGDLALTPERGVLLLTNGQLIEGTISAAGDRYDVVQRDGEIRVKRSQVALVARDARACYQHKLAEIDPNRVLDRLELAEWSLRNGLLAEAETELAAARVADRTHPKIPLVEARLRLARETPKPSQAASPPVPKPGAEVLDTVVRNLPPGAVESYTNHIQPLLLNTCTRSGCHGRSPRPRCGWSGLPPTVTPAASRPSATCKRCLRWSTARIRIRANY